jgi:hypothetical protein
MFAHPEISVKLKNRCVVKHNLETACYFLNGLSQWPRR